jgi:thymidylate synthase
MNQIKIDGISNGYKKVLDFIITNGNHVSPRGKDTLEVSPCLVTIENPRDRVFYDEIRNLNIGFSVAEWLWIVSGRDDVEMLSFYNSKIKNYSDDGITFHGAYGTRIRDDGFNCKSTSFKNQFTDIINKLKEDSDSRQCIVNIFEHYKDFVPTKDVPCTVTFQFLVRDNRLNMVTYMRSNDAYYGFPNDIFNFTMIQEMIATALDIDVGIYQHFAGSLHIYDTEFDKCCLKNVEPIQQGKLEFKDLNHWVNDIAKFEEFARKTSCFYYPNSSNKFTQDLCHVLESYIFLKQKRYDELETRISKTPTPYDNFFLRSLSKKS